jgi:hypothetical protein
MICYIVEVERRPFSYMDFVPSFNMDGKVFNITRGTFKNQVSQMLKSGELEVVCYSPQGFYSLKGVTVEKPLNEDHIGVPLSNELNYIKNDPFYRTVKNLPFGQKSLHNIRLRFEASTIWSALLSSKSDYKVQPRSKDISLPVVVINNLRISVVVHRTDAVSIIIGCSNSPVAVNVDGVNRLSNALGYLKTMLGKVFVQDNEIDKNTVNVVIPDYMDWIVTMWHFGADALAIYSGKENHRRWGIAKAILITIYTKEWENAKRRIRWDCQEYPKKPLKKALQDKLSARTSVS